MPPDDRRDCTTEILGRGLALGPARLDQRLQVHPCSVRQHRPLLIPGGAKRPPPQSVQARTGPRRRFSELGREAFCNREYARALKQRLDDEPEPIIAQSEAPVLKHPSVAALDRPAPLAQSRSGRLATLVDLGRDTEEAAELAMVLGVVALIGEHGPDAGHHGKGGQKQPLEDERVVDIGGRCHTRDRHPVSVYRDILLRAPLDTSCPAWPGPSDWAR